METLKEKFAFLGSSRFWAITVTALSIYLQTKGFIGEPEMVLIASIMGGFTIVRTVDRISDKRVEAAAIAASSDGRVPF